MTSGLPTQGHEGGVEASGSVGHPMIPEFKFGKSYMVENDGTEDVKKMSFMPQKIEQKGKLRIDPMVESSWKSKDYSVPTEEII